MNIPEQLEQFGKSPLYTVSNINQGITILPLFFLILVFASLLTWWLLNRTLLGRAIFAIGGNSDIAQRLGFDVRGVQIFVFTYAGLLAGIAGMVHVASNRIANPFDLNGLELTVIAAVILGGRTYYRRQWYGFGHPHGGGLGGVGEQRFNSGGYSKYMAEGDYRGVYYRRR